MNEFHATYSRAYLMLQQARRESCRQQEVETPTVPMLCSDMAVFGGALHDQICPWIQQMQELSKMMEEGTVYQLDMQAFQALRGTLQAEMDFLAQTMEAFETAVIEKQEGK